MPQSRTMIKVLSFFLLALLIVSIRMYVGSAHHLHLAMTASADNPQTIRRHLSRALAFYSPLNPWSRRAAEDLIEKARRLAKEGQKEEAIAFALQLRAGLLRLRGLYTPYRDLLHQANLLLSGTSAELSPSFPIPPQRWFNPAHTPRMPWVLLALLGCAGWILGVAGMIRYGFAPGGTLMWNRRTMAAVLMALGWFGAMCLGLYLA